MPKLPENMFAFVDAQGKQTPGQAALCDFKTVHPNNALPGNMVCNIARIDTAAENEITGRQLFLNTLTDMIREDGGKTDAAQAFMDAAQYFVPLPFKVMGLRTAPALPRIYGSQVMLSLHRFDKKPFLEKSWSMVGPPETTTDYGFEFMLPALEKKGTKDRSCAYYKLDARAFETLAKFQAPNAFQQQYLDGFVKMASMAEHDYLHQIISILENHVPMEYRDRMLLWNGPASAHVLDLEKHALGLHAKICDRLFTEEKPKTNHAGEPVVKADGTLEKVPVGARRKEKVLGWAAEQFKQLADVQDVAMAHATTKQERAQVQQAVTYFAEIYAHRLFRVISPVDKDLHDMQVRVAGEAQPTSVAAQAERMQFVVPALAGRPVTAANSRGLAGLRNVCELVTDDLYVKSHAMETMPVVTDFLTLWGVKVPLQTQEVTPHMLLDKFVHHGVPELQRKWHEMVKKDPQHEGPAIG